MRGNSSEQIWVSKAPGRMASVLHHFRDCRCVYMHDCGIPFVHHTKTQTRSARWDRTHTKRETSHFNAADRKRGPLLRSVQLQPPHLTIVAPYGSQQAHSVFIETPDAKVLRDELNLLSLPTANRSSSYRTNDQARMSLGHKKGRVSGPKRSTVTTQTSQNWFLSNSNATSQPMRSFSVNHLCRGREQKQDKLKVQ